MKHPCGRCKKKVTQTFCWPVGVWWDRPVCRHCAFVLRSSRDRQIEREMEKSIFKVDETWSLYGIDDAFIDRPFNKQAWDECSALVVEQRKELMRKDAGDGPDQAPPR